MLFVRPLGRGCGSGLGFGAPFFVGVVVDRHFVNRLMMKSIGTISPLRIRDFDTDVMIPHSQVAAIVRLLGNVAGMTTDLLSRKRILMDGLAQLVNADGWLWSATQVIKEENRPVSAGVLYAGLTESQFNGWLEASQIAHEQPPEDRPLTVLLNRGKHFTRCRHHVVPDHIWYNHPTVARYRLKNGIDHFLYSIYPLGPKHCSAIGLFRKVGREPFSDLECCVCHVIVANIRWLHKASFPDHHSKECVTLSPRQRTVLIHLLDGKSRDEIARLLHISPDTAKSHIRAVYRHFSVDSQVHLMRWFCPGIDPQFDPTEKSKSPATNGLSRLGILLAMCLWNTIGSGNVSEAANALIEIF